METDYNQMIEERVGSFFEKLSHRFKEEDMKRIRAAFELAREAHRDQKRKSGEPYIFHPIAVARIVAEELELGANPIIAAFLHDVVEDTSYTIEDIRDRFGEDVEFLVGVVTKKKKAKYDQSKQVDNYRQILASVHYDIRALLLKLADRLHNMRTLESMRPDKQMKIAGETDYFYAPLANRLGLYHVKSELENLSFKYRCPREFAALESQVEGRRAAERESLDHFVGRISQILAEHGIEVKTEVRYRKLSSIWRKMQALDKDIQHVDGQHYIRIIYPNPVEKTEKQMSLYIYCVLTDYFKECPGSVSNYIDSPKENGYQSFHVNLLNEHGKWEEIHIASERMVRKSRLGCTAERTEENVDAWLQKFRTILQTMGDGNDEMDFMEGVTSSFYNDDIFVFTPEGRGIILPKGASVLDFAFELHSDLGMHAKCARVNDKLCSAKTILHRGDAVEVITDDEIWPEEDWMDYVHTFKAKKSLRTYLSKRPHLPYLRCLKCHPLPGDEVVGFKDEEGNITLHKRNCKKAIALASRWGDSIVSVNFEENEAFLYPVRICVRGIDHKHLLRDIVACVTERQNLSMTRLMIETKDEIIECTIDFAVHSIYELHSAMDSILEIDGIDEVHRVDIE